MLFQMMYDMNSGLLIIIAAFILGLVAKSMVNSTFTRYSRVSNSLGLTGAAMARNILDNYGLAGVRVEQVGGGSPTTTTHGPKPSGCPPRFSPAGPWPPSA